MSEILIYCEGGGQGRATREMLSKGFREFFQELINIAKQKKINVRPLACGSRNEAYNKFRLSMITKKDAYNILLVDAEAPVNQPPWLHLMQNDKWRSVDCKDEQCHLMVQTMEAWFFADIETLSNHYGKNFQVSAFSKTLDIEKIDKNKLEPTLKKATRKTSKGEYQKIQHGAKLLALIAPQKVCKASKHCERLFSTVTEIINQSAIN